ncbi:hypothetical protein ACFPN0_04795 [Kitasatospora cinereorecta]
MIHLRGDGVRGLVAPPAGAAMGDARPATVPVTGQLLLRSS